MIEGLKFESWEPLYGRSRGYLWALQYQGCGNFAIQHRRNVWRGVAKWFDEARGPVDVLSNWARKTRDTDDETLLKQFGILLTGSYKKRLQRLRPSLIVLGNREDYETAGGIGTSFTIKYELTVYAELGDHGGIDVWGRKVQKFGCEPEIAFYEPDCKTIEELDDAISQYVYRFTVHDMAPLTTLLESIVAPITPPDSKQTYIALPKQKPDEEFGELFCTADEFEETWHCCDSEISTIRSTLRTIYEQELELDWHALLEHQEDLAPNIWEKSSCFTDMTGLITSFGCGWYTTESTDHSMCAMTTFEYYISDSHVEWFKSCLAFVANRLEIFVENNSSAV